MSTANRYLLRYRQGEDSPWQELYLSEGEIVVGRAPDCGLALDRLEVSRRHASLEIDNGNVWLTDLGSSNGTQIGERPLPPRERTALGVGQRFTIGPYHLEIEKVSQMPSMIPPSGSAEPGPHELGGTMIDVGVAQQLQVGVLHLADFEAVTIGRAPDNNLVLDHPVVSRYHAVIERMGTRFRLRDLRSSNGVFVNGQRVARDVWLKEQDEIRIGPHVFTMSGGSLQQQAETGLGIEACTLRKRVGRGTVILHDVSMTVRPQELVALVGMSGAGKTTLLNALSGYRPAKPGEVVVAGMDLYRHYDLFRNEIGYVPQKDIVHMELTPQAALEYAAQLRMPPDTTPAERKRRVAEVLADLDLTERRHVPIHRLSGGQLKRVSIGVELLTKPRLFFLDEPTSGLDPGTEYDMMKLLRRLADQGRTVVLVTHATKNVMLCDKVVFMARGGYLAYFGPPEQALGYFDGYRTPRERREKEMEFDDIYRILDDETRGTPEEWSERFKAS